jgi:hypothetical protein
MAGSGSFGRQRPHRWVCHRGRTDITLTSWLKAIAGIRGDHVPGWAPSPCRLPGPARRYGAIVTATLKGQKHPLSSARKCVRGRVCGVSSQAGLFNANWTNRGPPCSGLGQLFHMCMYQRLQKVISSHSHRKSFRSRATALEMCCQETEEPAPREIALRLVVRWEAHLCCARIEAVEGRGRLVHERVACGAPRHLRKCLPGHLVSRRASVRARSKPALGAVGHWCGVGGTGCVAARWAAQRAHPRPGK